MYYLQQFFYILLTPLRVLVTSPQRLFTTPRRLLGLSLAARISILLAIFLIVCVIVTFWAARHNTNEVWSRWRDNLPIAAVLAIVIPLVAYPVLRLWLEGETSAFEDIDRAWNAGLAELERNGLELTRLPLFLVLGSSGELNEKKLFEASRLSLTIAQFPQGAAALHWYATADAIYLVASEVGCLSKVAALGETVVEDEKKRQLMPTPAEPFNPHGGTMEVKVADIRETIAAPPPMKAPQLEPVAKQDYRGTMMLPSQSAVLPGVSEAAPAALDKMPIRLSREDREAQPLRLRYLCQLIRRVRQPYCAINGVLTLLPYNVIQRGGSDASEVQTSVQTDLTTLGQTFRMRFPAIALVNGLERESGFRELIRRVGFERARLQRFGKGFRVWDQATPEQLGALCIHACGAFELFIYELFREKDSLTSPEKAPGNRKLYTLLCRVRRDFQQRLDRILAGGYGHEPDVTDKAASVLFGGCYFAATGGTEATQAFTQSVFERLLEEQEELEWHPGMLREDAWYRRLAFAGFAFDAVLLAVAAVLFFKSK